MEDPRPGEDEEKKVFMSSSAACADASSGKEENLNEDKDQGKAEEREIQKSLDSLDKTEGEEIEKG